MTNEIETIMINIYKGKGFEKEEYTQDTHRENISQAVRMFEEDCVEGSF